MNDTSLPEYHVAALEDPVPHYENNADSITNAHGLKFPNDIEFYRTTFPSLVIGSPVNPNDTSCHLISYISITLRQQSNGGLPPIQVHSGPSPSSMVVGDVKFNSTPSTDLTIYSTPQIGRATEALHYKLKNSTILTTDVHSLAFPGPNGVENFEWRHSGDKAVKALATDNIEGENFSQNTRGLKLVRTDSMAIIAVYSAGENSFTLNPRKIAGKLRFLQECEEIEHFRLAVIMSILSMMERG